MDESTQKSRLPLADWCEDTKPVGIHAQKFDLDDPTWTSVNQVSYEQAIVRFYEAGRDPPHGFVEGMGVWVTTRTGKQILVCFDGNRIFELS